MVAVLKKGNWFAAVAWIGPLPYVHAYADESKRTKSHEITPLVTGVISYTTLVSSGYLAVFNSTNRSTVFSVNKRFAISRRASGWSNCATICGLFAYCVL